MGGWEEIKPPYTQKPAGLRRRLWPDAIHRKPPYLVPEAHPHIRAYVKSVIFLGFLTVTSYTVTS